MYKILVVEDEGKMREFISLYIRNAGYQCVEATDGQGALALFNTSFSLVLLDLMMPKLNGYEVCQSIREINDVPIFILTAVEEELAQLKCYELGADDYLTKPFKSKILLAKIARVLKRYQPETGVVVIDDICINKVSQKVICAEEVLKLSPKEYKLLNYFVDNKEIILTREQILNFVWKDEFDVGQRVVDNHVKKLRAKLKNMGTHIETVISVGYVFRERV